MQLKMNCYILYKTALLVVKKLCADLKTMKKNTGGAKIATKFKLTYNKSKSRKPKSPTAFPRQPESPAR
jgi:hypothetical protein